MAKLTIKDLDRITERVRRTTNLREGAGRAKVTVHLGTCGIAAGARAVLTALLEGIDKRDVTDVLVTTAGCAGLCSREPMVTVELPNQPPVKYVDLNADKICKILDEHVLGGSIVRDCVLAMGSERTE
jgi:NADP-reducing hydrogenase subunit HndB